MKNITAEQKTALNEAKNEKHFNAQNLLEEITPLIKDYFIAELDFDGKAINLSFLNGQKFRICAEEVLSV
ncbi:MAG: hypothetical protein HDQ88_02390 [Clostridia bacterium]|nr:hypothetical protein [Clostridia bacterium]